VKVVFNSREKEAACTIFYRDGFSHCKDIILYDSERYSEYDVALFMTYKKDLEDLKEVKRRYPGIKTAIIDPRGSWVAPYLPYADFLVVDSLEMKDFWAFARKPIFEYVEYPDIGVLPKNHREKEKIVIGYHGNKIHLECMYERITPALEQIAEKYDVEFWAMYNIADLGQWNRLLPKKIKIRHIQWSKERYHDELAQVDIGINPCFIPVASGILQKRKSLFRTKGKNMFNESPDDYILRFKMPSNSGRIIVWGLMGIPVVSDFIPSALRCIDDGEDGLLAYSSGGWYQALERLIVDHELRQSCADNMKKRIERRYDFRVQIENFLKFLSQIFPEGL